MSAWKEATVGTLHSARTQFLSALKYTAKYYLGRRVLTFPDTKPAYILILDFPSARSVRNKSVFLKNYLVEIFVLTAPTQYSTIPTAVIFRQTIRTFISTLSNWKKSFHIPCLPLLNLIACLFVLRLVCFLLEKIPRKPPKLSYFPVSVAWRHRSFLYFLTF